MFHNQLTTTMDTMTLTSLSIPDLEAVIRRSIREELKSLPQHKNEDYLTREETAKLLSISLQSLTNYMNEGKVPYYKLGRRTLFKRNEIESSINKLKSRS